MNLQVFKVLKDEDLVRVVRPAIFHQKDHFVYVGKDESLPKGEYTGNIIGSVPLGRVISLSEAKFIVGAKGGDGGGGIFQTIGRLIGVVPQFIAGDRNPQSLGQTAAELAAVAVAAPTIGAGIDSAFNAGLPLSGSSALSSTASNSAFNAARAASAINPETATFSAGAGQGAGLSGTVGAFNAATGASNISSSVSPGSLQSIYNSSNSGVPAGYSGTPSGLGAGTTPSNGSILSANGENPFSSVNNIGNFSPSSVSFNPSYDTSQFSLPPSLQTSSARVAGAVPSTSYSSPGILDSIGKGLSTSFANNPAGTIASGVGALGVFGSKAPEYNGATPTQNYSAVSQFLGPNALTQPTNDQLSTYISTPIEDLAKTFTSNSTRVTDAINQSYDNQKQGLVHQFAQAGQNTANSSELQDKISQLEQKRSTDLSNAAMEVQNAGISQAIQVKQQALTQGMQAGQFNQSLAMQLAGLTGDQQNLQYAIANNDYQSFQQIMGKLLTIGVPQNVKLTT